MFPIALLAVALPLEALLASSFFAPALLATLADKAPGFLFGLPLVALASLVFAATHHEDPAEIRIAAIHWTVWLGGILGMVLAGVLLLGWFS
ncbi:MAG: hypothetical protein DWH79_05215 [Planctomycetota bacterium]|nr:MAG: hypothetical protein DWH79_05215 [Planctomycetota bacterium]